MVEINQPFVIIRKKLSAAEVGGNRLRINPTTGEVESTPDGGTTWNPAPGEDPRHSDSFRLPPLSGADAACDAAARITAELQEALDIFLFEVTAATTVTSILGVLLLLTGPIGWAVDFIFAVSAAIIGIGLLAIDAEFTPTVWDELECIIYKHLDADGQMSAEAADDIYAEIFATYSSVISGTYAQLNSLYGEVLFSNAGVERTETGDCSECAWRAEFPVASGASGWSLFGAAGGEYVAGWHTTTVFVSGNPARPRRQCYITFAFDSCEITHIDFTYSMTFGVQPVSFATRGMFTNAVGTVIQLTTNTVVATNYAWNGLLTLDDIQLNIGSGGSDSSGTPLGDGTMTAIAIEGKGDPPSQFIPYLV